MMCDILRSLSLALVLALPASLSLLAGCHGSTSSSTKGGADPALQAPSSVAGTVTAPAPAEPTAPAPATVGADAPPALSPSLVIAHSRPAPSPTHVIIISEDGLRPDALSDELTPAHMQLIHGGTSARVARTIPDSDTLPSHASMLSGFGEREHGLCWNSYHPERGLIHVPTIFSVAKQNGLTTAMFVGKPKLKHLVLPGSVDHFERPSYLCAGVSKRAGEYFQAEKPSLMFVHFSDPDEYGHADGWMSKEYLRGVKESDRCLGTLLAALHESGLEDQTLVIVTADHGGHGKAHSGAHSDIDLEIPWIASGPGVDRDAVLDADVNTVDTAATALAALKLPMPVKMLGMPRLRFN